jgi:hypothetical protein
MRIVYVADERVVEISRDEYDVLLARRRDAVDHALARLHARSMLVTAHAHNAHNA